MAKKVKINGVKFETYGEGNNKTSKPSGFWSGLQRTGQAVGSKVKIGAQKIYEYQKPENQLARMKTQEKLYKQRAAVEKQKAKLSKYQTNPMGAFGNLGGIDTKGMFGTPGGGTVNDPWSAMGLGGGSKRRRR